MQKKRYASVAMLMHLLVPGLGFLYVGKLWVACAVPALILLVVFSLGWFREILEPWGIALLWGSLLLIYFTLLPIVFYVTRKNRKMLLKKSQNGGLYIGFAGLVLLLFVATIHYRAALFGYETFRLPSRSMANTLLPNDYIIVDTWAYKETQPSRGDIVVFKHPVTNIYFTKRIIAMPGDSVSIEQGKVKVNGLVLTEPYVLPENNSSLSPSMSVLTERVVPKKHYFVLGDNRDHSNDSRFWGFLAADSIYGQATSIWFSFSTKEGIRRNRIRKLFYKTAGMYTK